MTIVDAASLAIEVAKPVYGTLQTIYRTHDDRVQFAAILTAAGVNCGMTDEEAGTVTKTVTDLIDQAQKRSSRRVKKIIWPLRTNRGPGIDRLPTDKLLEWLDSLYGKATSGRAGGTVTISQSFWAELGKSFEPEQPTARLEYARKLLDVLERNDKEYRSYLATPAVLAAGLAGAGAVSALADGATGAVDTDLKTAVAALAGIMLTALLTALTRALESRIAPRQAIRSQQQDQQQDRQN